MFGIPYILAKLKKEVRYMPVGLHLRHELFVTNLFRLWEMIAGKPYGVRINTTIEQVNGEAVQVAFTLEQELAFFEAWVRSLSKKYAFKLVLIPQMQLAGFSRGGIMPFAFAIAVDSTAGQSNNNSPLSITLSGSDLNLHSWSLGDNSDNLATYTYNSVAMTIVQKVPYPSDRWTYQAIALTPATGTHNIAVTGLTFNAIAAASYTGCSQSSNPTAFNNVQNVSAISTLTIPTTVSATGSWVVGFQYGYGNNPSMSVGVRRVAGGSGASTWDTDGTATPGAFSIVFTSNIGAQQTTGSIMVLQPPVTGPTGIKTWNGVAVASVKTVNEVSIGSVKTINNIS